MADFTGHLVRVLHHQQAEVSVSLGRHDRWVGGYRGAVVPSSAPGVRGALGVIDFHHWSDSGLEVEGSNHWEKILVNPRAFDAGAVLSRTEWDARVWNTCRRVAAQLASVTVSGSGGLEVAGTLPATLWPGQERTFQASLPTDGAPTIDNLATWVAGGFSGVTMAVTGSRVYVFSPRMDWSEPFRKRLGWKTLVLTGEGGDDDQRIQLRTEPRFALQFRIQTTELIETQLLEVMLIGWHGRLYGVPVWPEQTYLDTPAAEGDVVLACDTAYRSSLAVGSYAMLWTGVDRWEAFQVESMTLGSLTTSAPLRETWPANAKVVPLRKGYLLAEQVLGRPTNWLSNGTFTFSCEGVR